ncbi:MAG: hypothetical protein AAGF93_13245 [Cyanobacteria bacterium P01_H01_bin.105]
MGTYTYRFHFITPWNLLVCGKAYGLFGKLQCSTHGVMFVYPALRFHVTRVPATELTETEQQLFDWQRLTPVGSFV